MYLFLSVLHKFFPMAHIVHFLCDNLFLFKDNIRSKIPVKSYLGEETYYKY